MSHYGLHGRSQTLWDECSAVTTVLGPTYDAIFKHLRPGPVIGLDQTSWPDMEDKTLPPWQKALRTGSRRAHTSQDGSHILFASADNTAKLWATSSGRRRHTA